MLTHKRRLIAALLFAAIVFTVIILAKNQNITRFFKQEVVISIAGDILLDRGVAKAIEKNDASYPYNGVTRIFNHDDITIANLECPLTLAGGGALKAKRFVFKAEPSHAVALKSAGFDVLMLANNHTMDYWSEGLADTMEALSNSGILYAGAGLGEDKIQPCFIKKNGINIGILSYSSLPPEGFVHIAGKATIAYARTGFLDKMRSEVASTAERCDFLIVYFHWGIEYRHDVSDAQIEIAHAAVDSGASVVVGTHPHVLQGRETYKGAPIYYSVGNFVFDKQIPDGTDEALILQITLSKSQITAIDELPIVIEACQPYIPDSQKSEQIKADVARYSRRFE